MPSDSLPGDQLAADGVNRFVRGDTAEALTLLVEAAGLGTENIDAYEFLLLLAKGTEHELFALDMAEALLGQSPEVAPIEQARLAVAVLAAADPALIGGHRFSRLLLAALQAAAAAGESGWSGLNHSKPRDAIFAALQRSELVLEVAEQLLYAPAETGWPAIATQHAETAASAARSDPDLARAAERMLHAFGEAEAAYRVQRIRKTWMADPQRGAGDSIEPSWPVLQGVTVAVCGGHSALRTHLGRQVAALGGGTREIPSRFEAVRRERDVVDTLRGSDVAIVIIPQIAHSTADQVKRAASRLSVQVVPVFTASANSIISVIIEWRGSTRT